MTTSAPRGSSLPRVTDDQVRWFRVRQSGLATTPFTDPEDAARALFGVQAQINSAGRLALWHRLGSQGASDPTSAIEAALDDTRTLVRLWGQRGTLHLYATDDWPLVRAAMGERGIEHVAQRARRYEAKGGPMSVASLESAGRLAHEILRRPPHFSASKSDLEREGTEADVRAHYGAFVTLCMQGEACRIDTGDSAPIVIAWRPERYPDLEWRPPSFEHAMVEVARRFFSAYGPATERDFRYWQNAPASESRPPVDVLREAGELVDVEVDDGSGGYDVKLVTATELPKLLESPPPWKDWPVRLLGRFDPLLLAQADKSCWVEAEFYRRVWHHTHVEPVLLLRGRICGVWRYKRGARGMTINLQLFGSSTLPASVERAVRQQATAVSAFFGTSLLDLNIDAVS